MHGSLDVGFWFRFLCFVFHRLHSVMIQVRSERYSKQPTSDRARSVRGIN